MPAFAGSDAGRVSRCKVDYRRGRSRHGIAPCRHGLYIPQLKAAPPIRRSAAAVTPHERDLASKRDTEPQDHCSSSCQRELNDEEWGLPVLNCVRWDWKGPPTSMTTTGKRNRRKEDSLPKSDDIDNNDGFYCRVELRGSHVLAGLRAWQERPGSVPDPLLPAYVRDVALYLGSGTGNGTVVVDHGAVLLTTTTTSRRQTSSANGSPCNRSKECTSGC